MRKGSENLWIIKEKWKWYFKLESSEDSIVDTKLFGKNYIGVICRRIQKKLGELAYNVW